MRAQLPVVVVVLWALCAITVVATICQAKFDLYRVCPMAYGSVLSSIPDTESAVICSNECQSEDTKSCRSWMYDPGTRVCEINSRTEEVTSFPGSCGNRVYWGRMEKATCRDTWLDSTCSSDSNCHVPNSACQNGACRCSEGYAYMFRTDSCMANCEEYGSTFKEEYHYILGNNLHRYYTSLDSCLDDCVTKYPTCRMVEYEVAGTACYITTVTALTNPDDIVYENSADFIQFLRNCK